MDAQSPTNWLERLRGALGGTSEASLTNRLAGTVFVIRVFSAGLAYLSQILLARWMSGSEYGVFVYVWTWVVLVGSLLDFGLSVSAQKLIPEYRGNGEHALLRGFLTGSRLMVFGTSSLMALVFAGIVYLLTPSLEANLPAPLYIGCLILPAFVVANMQEFIVRQTLIIAFTAGMVALGLHLGATAATLISAAAVWLAMIGQLIVLNRRLRGSVSPGTRAYEISTWLVLSLPIMMVEGFFLLLSHIDILVLQQYRSAEEVGIYFAVVKTLALVSFIHYAMSATTAHRFTEYYTSGDTERLSAYVTHAIKWTFWPSLAATLVLLAFGEPLLWLFGPQFTAGYGIMFVAAIGLISRAAIGPVERLLNMSGNQNTCALAYASAFVVNIVLCVILVPRYGGYGAAAATSAALVFESIVLFALTKRKLGLHVLAFGGRQAS